MRTYTYDAIVFDLLDTVYPWGPSQYGCALDALCATVAARRPPATPEEVRKRYVAIRSRISAGNITRLVENDFPAAIQELVGTYDGDARDGLSEEGLRNYNLAFAGALELPPAVGDMLRRLAPRYTLGALSNYPTSSGIRMALERDGLTSLLSAIVVSAEVGFVKPHPVMFRTICDEIGCSPERVLVVGDTWESDVVGAYLAGMPCVRVKPSDSGVEQGKFFHGHIRAWIDSQKGHDWTRAKPLAEIESVLDLETWLG